jgi:hypothetical protein
LNAEEEEYERRWDCNGIEHSRNNCYGITIPYTDT